MNTPETEFDDGLTEFHEEWLSAYLDGELTDAQRQCVEDRLANDSAAQEMLGDLERIRGLVRELPGWSGSGLNLDVTALSDAPPDAPSVLDASDVQLQAVMGADESQADVPLGRPAPFAVPRRKSVLAWWRPLTLAASLLAMLGIGYALWPSVRQRDNMAANFFGENEATSPSSAATEEWDYTKDREENSAPPPDVLFAEDEKLSADWAAPMEMEAEEAPGRSRVERFSMPPQAADTNFGGVESLSADSQAMRGARGGGEFLPDAKLAKKVAENGTVAGMGMAQLQGGIADHVPRELAMGEQANSPRREVYFGRSASWTAEAMQRELTSNQALSQLRAESANQELTLLEDAQQTDFAPVAVARIPGDADGKQLFERLLAENGLVAEQSVTTRPLGREEQRLGALDSRQALAPKEGSNTTQNEALESFGAKPPAAPPNAAASAQAGASALDRQEKFTASRSQSVVLFLTRAVAEQILKEVQPSTAKELGSGNYLWIIPATEPAARQDDERVILLMNSVQN